MADVATWAAVVLGGVGTITGARSLRIQAQEHKRLTMELVKRADFEMSIGPMSGATDVGPDSATIVTAGTTINLRFSVGIRNTGTRAATHVTLNFLAPDRHATLAWTGPNGEPMPDKPPAATTSEKLDNEPRAAETRWLIWEFERIAVRTPRMVYAVVATDVPINGAVDFPVRVRVQSDDLPDDVPERVKDYVVHVRHG